MRKTIASPTETITDTSPACPYHSQPTNAISTKVSASIFSTQLGHQLPSPRSEYTYILMVSMTFLQIKNSHLNPINPPPVHPLLPTSLLLPSLAPAFLLVPPPAFVAPPDPGFRLATRYKTSIITIADMSTVLVWLVLRKSNMAVMVDRIELLDEERLDVTSRPEFLLFEDEQEWWWSPSM